MTEITPVLLCGGSGTRLWPLSRKAMPKQFTPLLGDETLYQSALTRLSGPGWAAPVVVTADAYLTLARDQAAAVGIAPACLMVEPSARNTAPAVLAAALHLMHTAPDTLVLVAPSDHAIPDAEAFRAAVEAGTRAAAEGRIVTFGIRPTRAETGYGWLELGEHPDDFALRPLALKRFVEKPKAAQAEDMLAAGHYLWNAGIFLASAATLVSAFRALAPGLMEPVEAAVDSAQRDGLGLHLASQPWNAAEDISIDFAVMERATNLCVVPFAAGWSDLGDWDAILRETAPKPGENATRGNVTALDCAGSLLRSDCPGTELVGIGLTGIVVVATEDAVLVAHRSRAQEVKQAVAQLKARRVLQAEGFAARDGAWSETESDGSRFASRCVRVAPGASCLHPETAPDTTWMVLQGRAVLYLPGDVAILTVGVSLTCPGGTSARIANPDAAPLVLVEMQVGGQRASNGVSARPISLEHFGFAAE